MYMYLGNARFLTDKNPNLKPNDAERHIETLLSEGDQTEEYIQYICIALETCTQILNTVIV